MWQPQQQAMLAPSQQGPYTMPLPLRRFLCVHSTGNANDHASVAPYHLPMSEMELRSPYIMARLMGLDMMPAEVPHGQPTLPLPLC